MGIFSHIKNIVSGGSSTETINGKTYQGSNVSIVGGDIFIDGKPTAAAGGLASAPGEPSSTEQRTPSSPFSSISSSLPIEIEWSQEGACSASLTGPASILAAIEVSCSAGGLLTISSTKPFSCAEPLRAKIASPTLAAIDLGGAAALAPAGSPSFGALRASLSGAAKATLSGTAASLSADLDGISKLRARALASPKLDARLAGNSKAKLAMAGSAILEIDGHSKCSLAGSGALRADISGASKLTHGGGSAENAQIKTDGASEADIVLHGPGCSLSADGASDIRYARSAQPCQPSIRRSGAASVAERELTAEDSPPAAPDPLASLAAKIQEARAGSEAPAPGAASAPKP